MLALARAPYRGRQHVTKDEAVKEWWKALGSELAQARKDLDISQDDMADRLSLGRTTLSKIERGLNPTLPHYLRYALEVDVDFALIAARARLIVKARGLEPDEPELI